MMPYSGFKVLIVDDNPNNLFSLQSLLNSQMDVEILQAEGGKKAIELALNTPQLDLIILDVQMPEMDGFETASMLKIRKKTRDIPIIFLTAAFKSDEFQQKGYALGAADYLLKPIDDHQLLNKISTYFRLIEKERDLNRRLEEQVAERTAELKHANNHLQNILQAMGEALLILDPAGKIKSVNPAACEMLGYNQQELVNMAIGDVFEEEDQVQAKAFMGIWLEALIRTGAIRNIEARFIAQDNSRVPILFSRTALRNDNNEISDIICIAKNMSGYSRLSDQEAET